MCRRKLRLLRGYLSKTELRACAWVCCVTFLPRALFQLWKKQDNTDEATRKEIAPELAKLIDAMNKIGDVKEGDLVDFEFSGKTTTVLVNGKLVADNIGGKKLFDSVLRIWLGENAIDDKLKKSMLGL